MNCDKCGQSLYYSGGCNGEWEHLGSRSCKTKLDTMIEEVGKKWDTIESLREKLASRDAEVEELKNTLEVERITFASQMNNLDNCLSKVQEEVNTLRAQLKEANEVIGSISSGSIYVDGKKGTTPKTRCIEYQKKYEAKK